DHDGGDDERMAKTVRVEVGKWNKIAMKDVKTVAEATHTALSLRRRRLTESLPRGRQAS
ncbi:unnamed protein product, partial [Allacma fusca]